MLMLTRKPGETILIGVDIKITICEVRGKGVKLGIDAPPRLRVLRGELDIYDAIIIANKPETGQQPP
ncbi:MAG TPA: carbon storage regulator [Candidatus Magasanikbacteria bacterium]|uniref:Translational regulator CsrA n=2 Tax=Candidatus Magasanikiibacteriota TaxID=1752731 RepID=A0A0G0WML6_9BACT|nr:MAG: putative CsrA_thema carbon storage regulator-like protein [Candidatus Magasanikbacteria bacterium GW2011_GWC2_41_17]KKS13327.1 MAG: putative CsrA_thema carbon storage regulator-like protein [Candidatus Magasanikbacteria bacterium GW2011_GWA2_41_55]HBV57998.1 carbon storage regulator [Candidatus Magasanikbacteria bacterium]HBX16318.1 carbon storage regulator [Candidatus Magasanikbacteria bacterium]